MFLFQIYEKKKKLQRDLFAKCSTDSGTTSNHSLETGRDVLHRLPCTASLAREHEHSVFFTEDCVWGSARLARYIFACQKQKNHGIVAVLR